jgi:hypothetical protein
MGCPALYCRAVHCEPSSIASCPSRHRRALHNNIAKPSSALSPSQRCPSPSQNRPSPSRPLRRAIHCKLSIATLSSHASIHLHAIFCKQSIVSRPSLHRQAVIVHHELSIVLSPSRPALYCQAVHRQAVHCRAVQRFIAELSIAKPSIAEPSIAPSCLS